MKPMRILRVDPAGGAELDTYFDYLEALEVEQGELAIGRNWPKPSPADREHFLNLLREGLEQ